MIQKAFITQWGMVVPSQQIDSTKTRTKRLAKELSD